jgi:hypothetical protein
MKLVIKKEPEIVETRTLDIDGEKNSFNIKEDEYGDTVRVIPAGAYSPDKRPFKVLVGNLVLNFESDKLIISRTKDEYTEEFLIEDRATGKVHWGSDPHVNPEFTGKRRKVRGKNFKEGKPSKPEHLKTERYEVPELVSEYFMIDY